MAASMLGSGISNCLALPVQTLPADQVEPVTPPTTTGTVTPLSPSTYAGIKSGFMQQLGHARLGPVGGGDGRGESPVNVQMGSHV
ncbi:hypothetical protein GCM10023205_71050 [Yinghuangia aomiensis]|uniref:Uncharacterized protein n=1 Tax=Yinghuangia aomiensis TaxID=676205 RepID=A0ABP9I663_9ACTN